ncbi:hypothetical protein K7711_38290 [Nocardia sp. CA2R105]|uniref:hypothetical protein n=1 Tax=Nocardia coffeae TaxID=2873381 RepID=UPI001CA78DF7|nr:hypothetical protein [Nocardia coffeae]MBY8862374.1 hypothetical protein [Nocardia coffeae]
MGSGVGGFAYDCDHDCADDPRPIGSLLIAVAWADLTRRCDPDECWTHARAREVLDAFGFDLDSAPRQCLNGAYNIHASRVNAWVVASRLDRPDAYCGVGPGPVTESAGRKLVDLHRCCDTRRCRVKQLGQQAITGTEQLSVPECRVPEDRIVRAVERVMAADIALEDATHALHAGGCEAPSALLTAAANSGFARRHRDALFVQGLPEDGTVPLSMIIGFGLGMADVRRLVPNLSSVAPPGRRGR